MMSFNADVLKGAQVLVLEDDYYLATDIQHALEAANARVVGPFGDEAEAMGALAVTVPACALIDVNLGKGPSFQVPRKLVELGVPFAFVTGYDAGAIPEEFAELPRCEKPIDARTVIEVAVRLLRPIGLSR